MNRRESLLTMAAGAAGTAFAAKGAARKPNIIFIMVDDMGYHDLGCYGSKTIKTPNLDRMCKEGMKFTDCYSGAAVCAPARSTLMTGTHMGHTPVRGNSGGIPLHPEDVTVAEVLKKAGYINGGFGKWGLGNQGKDGAAERQGFDLFYGYYNQWHAHTYYTHLFRNSEKVELNGRYTHHAIYDETINFIKKAGASGKPFFCYCPWTPPHAAYEIPEDEPAWQLYKNKPWEHPEKCAAAMDSMMDRQVGEIINLLKKMKIDDNTIIFFTSDNGASKRFEGVHNSCGEMSKGKGSMNEGGLRVPMIVRWPRRIKPGSVSDLPWYFPDVMPTFAELAGVSREVSKDIDGISVVPTLLGTGKQKKHEYLYWARHVSKKDPEPTSTAARMGKWKAVRLKGKVSLYDLPEDIGEQNNLAGQHPDIAAKLTKIMDDAWVQPRPQVDDGIYHGLSEEALQEKKRQQKLKKAGKKKPKKKKKK